MRKICVIAVVVFISQVVVSGCAVAPRITEDTIVKIYAAEKEKAKDCPIIFVPGIFGTVLEDGNTGKVIWGNVSKGLITELALPIESANMLENVDQVVPVKVLAKFSWIPGLVEKSIYERAQVVAVKAAGYEMGKDAFSFSYDWRRDLVEASRRLGELIDEIKNRTGKHGLKFNIVCHSAGGLVTRYYAKYGVEDVLDRDPIPEPTYAGAANINKVIMLGTPNYGSLESFRHIHEGLNIPGIGYTTKDVIFTIPSAYELMPAGDGKVFINVMGEDLDVSLYDPSSWEKYGWSVFDSASGGPTQEQRKFLAVVLRRARAFHEALWKGDSGEEGRRVTYILLGSDATPTMDKAVLRKTKAGLKTQFDPHDDTIRYKVFAPGDGSVTRKSLLGTHEEAGVTIELPSEYEIFFAQHHVDLAGDPTFMDNVLHSLLDKTTN